MATHYKATVPGKQKGPVSQQESGPFCVCCYFNFPHFAVIERVCPAVYFFAAAIVASTSSEWP